MSIKVQLCNCLLSIYCCLRYTHHYNSVLWRSLPHAAPSLGTVTLKMCIANGEGITTWHYFDAQVFSLYYSIVCVQLLTVLSIITKTAGDCVSFFHIFLPKTKLASTLFPICSWKWAVNCNDEGPVRRLQFVGVMYVEDQSARRKRGRGAAGVCSPLPGTPAFSCLAAAVLPSQCRQHARCFSGGEDYIAGSCWSLAIGRVEKTINYML